MNRVRVRRVGNSLGVLLPKATLEAWGVREGDDLELTERALRPRPRRGFAHRELDEHRRRLALAVVGRFSAAEIRAQILANLHRWARNGVSGPAYDEWRAMARSGDDGALYAVMLGRDEDAVRLRQSAPYTGLLADAEVRALNEEAAG